MNDQELKNWVNIYNKAMLMDYKLKRTGVIKKKEKVLAEVIKKELINPKFILEVGCSTGSFLNYIKKFFPKTEMFGIDCSTEMLKIGKEKYKDINLSFGFIEKMHIPSNKFDAVIAIEVLEHVKDLDVALKEIHRVTNKYLFGSVPYNDYLTRCELHLRIFDFDSLENYFSDYFTLIFKKKVEIHTVFVFKKKKGE